ncbi:hypothetical protein J4403_02975 [Candidatus Woesearchaeota archaeon]|nr:hypothetical protein [Candidatus Woesearchaeota archaeon]
MLEIKYDYLILRGNIGVGKTTTLKKLIPYFHKSRINFALIDCGELRKYIGDKEPSYKNRVLCAKNTILLANSFIQEGYFTLLEWVLADQDLLDQMKKQISGEGKLIRLSCSLEQNLIRNKCPNRMWPGSIDKIVYINNLFEKNKPYNLNETLIDNNLLSAEEVANQIINLIKK